MPSKSAKQHRLMELIAHGGKPKSGKGPSVKVAREFVRADKGKTFPAQAEKAKKAKKARTAKKTK